MTLNHIMSTSLVLEVIIYSIKNWLCVRGPILFKTSKSVASRFRNLFAIECFKKCMNECHTLFSVKPPPSNGIPAFFRFVSSKICVARPIGRSQEWRSARNCIHVLLKGDGIIFIGGWTGIWLEISDRQRRGYVVNFLRTYTMYRAKIKIWFFPLPLHQSTN